MAVEEFEHPLAQHPRMLHATILFAHRIKPTSSAFTTSS